MADAPHPLRIANFRAYWASRLSGTIAVSAQAIVIGWQVYGIARQTMDIREAAFLLGMIGLAQFVPLFVLTPVVGLVADSVDRRWIVRATTALLVLNAAALGLLTWAGDLSLPFLFGAAVLIGVVRAFGKQDMAGAEQAWQQVMQLDPTGPEGQAAKRALDSLKQAVQGDMGILERLKAKLTPAPNLEAAVAEVAN